MATILLQATGSILGGVFGSTGATLGAAAGAIGGYMIDQSLFRTNQDFMPPEAGAAKFFSAEEGTPLPRVYGVARIGGAVIWMTHFQKSVERTRQGGKGFRSESVSEKSYSYYVANIAFGLCEGEIAGVRRIWVDGKEMDLQGCTMRVYTGTETQSPDPIIEAVQGSGNVPAYRGLAYVVFENLNLGPYGNRIPQIQFEVLRPIGSLHKNIPAVALIPGSTEYGLSTNLVRDTIRPGEEKSVNRHIMFGATDLEASLDELKMLCPSLEHVALVITWFGNDLRAGHCSIRPCVTDRFAGNYSQEWSVRGIKRSSACEVSKHEGKSAFGGSPSDDSVIQAIKAIKKKGLKVTLYPFIMMDVLVENTLQDPYGEERQASYPWRGRITCYPGPDMKDSADKTENARVQVMQFCGKGKNVQNVDWNYRSFILHTAHLAQAAGGGIDAFLIGSELRGLTTLRDEKGRFPFVEELCTLAHDVRKILGNSTKITYGADWSEYFGYQPADGSGDVFFHLDPLWSHPCIDAIGIDNYMPLSDWRDTDYEGNNPDGFKNPYDESALKRMIAGGEGFDWFYQSDKAREDRTRTPISDGACQKPWVYRYKDLVSWWKNQHYDRIGGREKESPTEWVPQSKPIWFTEIGCPCVDKGPNQPGVFVDAKSSESSLPYFSKGYRSDFASRKFLKAHFNYWNGKDLSSTENNPPSTLYQGSMVDCSRIYLWAWDSRPFPAFPLYKNIWADSVNWDLGHWLNGKLSFIETADFINAVFADHGLPDANVEYVSQVFAGYTVKDPSTVRQTLQPVLDLFNIYVKHEPQGFIFSDRVLCMKERVIDELVFEEDHCVTETTRIPDHDLPATAVLSFRDPMNDFQSAVVQFRKQNARDGSQKSIFFPGCIEHEEAQRLVQDWLRRFWLKRETVSFKVPLYESDILAGSLISLPAFGFQGSFLVERVEEGKTRHVFASKVSRRPIEISRVIPEARSKEPNIFVGSPLVHFLDLPLMPGQTNPADQFQIAVWKKPWKPHIGYISAESTGFQKKAVITLPASLGVLPDGLEASSASGRINRSTILKVLLFDSEVSSVSLLHMLNGRNAVAVFSKNDEWEIIQFQHAEEVKAGEWHLKNLLRGQLGTEDSMREGAKEGAAFVILNDALVPSGLHLAEAELSLNWRFAVEGSDLGSLSTTGPVASRLRALRPLAPVHLKCQKIKSGEYRFSWIRRSRLDAENWGTGDIPLGEENEEYEIEVKEENRALSRRLSVFSPEWIFSQEDLVEIFGAMPVIIKLTVRQKGSGGRLGFPAVCQFSCL